MARKRSQVTTVGILLDPIADKLLISAAFISLVELRLVPAWMVVIIVGRELAVSGMRSIASAEGFALKPSELGKTKMVFQVVAICVIALQSRYPATKPLATVLLWTVVIFAVFSALQYFRLFWRQLDSSLRQREAHRLSVIPGDEKQPEEKDVAAHRG